MSGSDEATDLLHAPLLKTERMRKAEWMRKGEWNAESHFRMLIDMNL